MLSKLKVNYSLVKSGMPKVVPAEFVTCGGISLKEIDFRRTDTGSEPTLAVKNRVLKRDRNLPKDKGGARAHATTCHYMPLLPVPLFSPSRNISILLPTINPITANLNI
jgi:hypothetical protein